MITNAFVDHFTTGISTVSALFTEKMSEAINAAILDAIRIKEPTPPPKPTAIEIETIKKINAKVPDMI